MGYLVGSVSNRRPCLRELLRLLAGGCLVTLTGPGGSGRTRLCIALAAEVAGDAYTLGFSE